MSRHSTPRDRPVPSAFIAASFAAKRAANEDACALRAFAVGDFTGGVDALFEARAVALEHIGDARDLGDVESEAD